MNQSAIIFDLDGTLTRPYLDFDVIRKEIGIDGAILETVETFAPEAKARAEKILLRWEQEAAENATLQEGAIDVIHACRAAKRGVGILTRNARATVNIVLSTHGIVVDALRTREDGSIKPSGFQVLSICEELRADPAKSFMIGDYLLDIQSGIAGGTKTVLMLGDKPRPDYADQADYVIRSLRELLDILAI